jgi:hypothetical protein
VARDTEFTSATAAGRVKANSISWFDVAYLGADFGDDSSAIAARDVRQCHLRASHAAPDREIDVIESRSLQFDDRIRRQDDLGFGSLFITKLFGPTVSVKSNRFQTSLPVGILLG